jgi:hypothetical protein
VEQQFAEVAAAGPHASLLVPAAVAAAAPQALLLVPPIMTWIPPHPFHPNPYLYGAFHPFNSFNSNI